MKLVLIAIYEREYEIVASFVGVTPNIIIKVVVLN
jgi:hypothetical protein